MVGAAGAGVERDGVGVFHELSAAFTASSSPIVFDVAGRRSPAIRATRGVVAAPFANRCAKRLCSLQIFFHRRLAGGSCAHAVTSPFSASKIGNSPVSMASRASLIVSCDAAPQPSGQGTLIWM